MSTGTQLKVQAPNHSPIATIPRVRELFGSFGPAISSGLPSHMNAGHFVRSAIYAIIKNKDLLACSELSIVKSVEQAANLGLLIDGVLGHGYLVPFKDKCEFVPGYRGLIELCRRSGVIKTFSAHVVRPEDDFDYQYGSDQFLRHKPARKYADSKKWTHAYAIAEFANGGCQFEVMNYDEIMDHKKQYSRGSSRSDSPWNTAEMEMGKKTTSRRLIKMLPVSPDILRMAMLDEYHEAGALDSDRQGNQRSNVRTREMEFPENDDVTDIETEQDDDQQVGAQGDRGDLKSQITERFAQATVAGEAAVSKLYDELAGPESTLPQELTEYVDQCHMIAKRRLADRAKESGGKSGGKQKPLLDQ